MSRWRNRSEVSSVKHRSAWGLLWAIFAGASSVGVGEAQEPRGFFEGPVEPEVINPGVVGIWGLVVSAEERTIYFTVVPGDPRGDDDIYYLTRESRDVPFVGPARPLEGLNSHPFEEWVHSSTSLSADGREIYFTSTREGPQDLWVARFNDPWDPEQGFATIQKLGPGLNTHIWERIPQISRDGLRLYFFRDAALQMGTLATMDTSSFHPPQPPGPPGSWPAFSADERTIVYDRDDTIWMATRETVLDDDGGPVPFGDSHISTGLSGNTPTLTLDWPSPGSGLYFQRGLSTIWRARWHPDCNGNGQDDLEEIEKGDVEDVDRNGVPDACQDEPDWIDCFADGQIFDGDPVVWTSSGPENCAELFDCTGELAESQFETTSSGGLLLRPCGLDDANSLWLFSEDDRRGDVSVRLQARLLDEGELWAMVHLARCGRGYGAMISTSPVHGVGIALARFDDGLFPAFFEFTPAEILPQRDYMVQFDVEGAQLTLRIWTADQGTAAPPLTQVTVRDGEIEKGRAEGRVVVGHINRGVGAYAIVHELRVSDATIAGGETECPSIRFLRGDCNGDGEVNISDATCALDRLFAGGAAPGCGAALNTNGDNVVNIADPVFLLGFLFGGGPMIFAPFPDCGPGTLPADAELGCANPPPKCR